MKHNKKRNTAFLYECLIKELTKSIIKKDNTRKQKIIEIITLNFKQGSALKQDLDVYQSFLENKKMTKDFAKRFLFESKKDFESIDRRKVFNEQTSLINQINKNLSKNAFSNFIPNYKDLASIGQYLSSGLKAKNRILVENRIISILSSEKEKIQEMSHIDNLTYKTFVNKFNDTYDGSLLKEQKDLLMNYIVSFSDNGLGLKSFLNEEISRLRDELYECTKIEKIAKNESFLAKTEQVLSQLNEYSKKPITINIVKDIFYIQDLISEINKNGS